MSKFTNQTWHFEQVNQYKLPTALTHTLYISVKGQARGLGLLMPEYSVFFCAPTAQKKTKANVFSDLDQTSLVGKRFIMLPQQNLFLWDNLKQVIPSMQDKSI